MQCFFGLGLAFPDVGPGMDLPPIDQTSIDLSRLPVIN